MRYKEHFWQMKQRSAFINQILRCIFIVSNFCSDMKVLLNDTKFYIVASN